MHPQARYDIEQQATILFDENEIPLSKQEWQQLSDLLISSNYEHIVCGDANERHSVWVSRYFNDVGLPTALNNFSEEIAVIVMSQKMRHFYRQFAGTDKLCLRRCQANRMYKDDFIGEHRDQDSSPEYLATIVFHFSKEYSGGYFVTSENEHHKPGVHMALVNNCSVPHRITRVEGGERLTLACFLSPSFSANKNRCPAFKIDDKKRPQ